LYAFTENFVLPISHDEVVHGKGSFLNKMPGDEWRKFANARAFLAYMYAHPGKKLLFMGCEIGQYEEWNANGSVRWELLQYEPHRRLQLMVQELNRLYSSQPALYEIDFNYTGFEWVDFHDVENSVIAFIRRAQDPRDFLLFCCNFTPVVRELNRLYRASPALYEVDFHHTGFEWVDFADGQNSIIAFLRRAEDPNDFILVCCNFTPVPRTGYEFGVPAEGFYREILNTDSEFFGGSQLGNGGVVSSRPVPRHGRPCSISVTLPPLAVVAFRKV